MGFLNREGDPAPGRPPGQRGPRGQGQLVAGEMLRGAGQGLFQGPQPGVRRLPRQAVDQVQSQVFKTRGPDQRQGRPGLGGRVPPLKEGQLRLIKGLGPQAQAVGAQVPPEAQLLPADIVRVGFQGELGVGGKREMEAHSLSQAGNLRPG